MRELFKFKTEIRVTFEDVDVFSVVNNAKYFSYFERARVEYLRNLGFVSEGKDSVMNFESVVVENFCAYKKPAVFDDLIQVFARISYMKRSSLQFQYYLFRERDSAVLATGYTNLVWYDSVAIKPKPIKPEIKKAVIVFEGDNLGKMTDNPKAIV